MKKIIVLFCIILMCIIFAHGVTDKCKLYFSPLAALSTNPYDGWVGYDDSGEFYFKREFAETIIQYASWEGFHGLRVLPYAQWWCPSREAMFQPFHYDKVLRKFDLSRWNHKYFEIVGEFIRLANLYGMEVCFCLFDLCGTHLNQPKLKMNPWLNNIQGILHFVEGAPYNMILVQCCLNEFEKYDVVWELCNEFGYGDPGKALSFAKKVFNIFKIRGVPLRKISLGAQAVPPFDNSIMQNILKSGQCLSKIYGEDAKLRAYRPIHGAFDSYNHEDCEWGPEYEYAKRAMWLPWFFSNDGTYHSFYGCDGLPPMTPLKRPRARELYAFMTDVLDRFSFHAGAWIIFEHCPKNLTYECQGIKLKEMTRAYFERFDRFPPNYHKYELKYYETDPDPEPDPEPEPDPIPEPEPDKINWWIVGAVIALAVLALLVWLIGKSEEGGE